MRPWSALASDAFIGQSSAMSRQRLPVYRSPAPAPEAYAGAPRVIAGRAIVVADPQDGALSLAFAARLSGELARLGRRLLLAVASFEAPFSLSPAQRALFPDGQSIAAFSLAESDAAIAERLEHGPDGPFLLVGPATLAFESALSILLAADVPVLRWPDALREARPRFDLLLSGDGLSVVAALARGLLPG
jgi:hypothetical protein